MRTAPHPILALARSQKVDLLKLSVTRLADQYLAFVQEARTRRFALAADYLVMAAWLAYLKSRLLLPKPERPTDEESPPEEVAARLAFRLAKLGAMRDAAQALKMRPTLGRDVFARGDPQAIRIVSHTRLDGDLHALMTAYVGQKKRQEDRRYRPEPPPIYPLDDARDRLRSLVPRLERWTPLSGVAPIATPRLGPVAPPVWPRLCSASLELVRERATWRRASSITSRNSICGPARRRRERPRPRRTHDRSSALRRRHPEPLSAADLASRLPVGADVDAGLEALLDRYAERGVELVCVAGRWRFQTAADLAFLMSEEREEPRRLSRAAQETLAIIAYHQPVTRADIESVRGVRPSSGTLDIPFWNSTWCACAAAAAPRAVPSPSAPPTAFWSTLDGRSSPISPARPR